MNGFLNKAQLIGNLGRDPEVRSLGNGNNVAVLSIATSESWKDKQTGDRVEKTEWHRVVIYNETLCMLAETYLTKGSKVFVEGQLKTRKWTDNAGVERYVTEIHLTPFNGTLTLLDSKRNTEDRATRHEPAAPGAGGGIDNSLDDDVLF